MRTRAHSSVLFACAALAVSARSTPAHAWACPSGSNELATAFPRASLVFIARAVSATRVTGRDERQTRVEVLRVLRGSAVQQGAVVTVYTCRGGKCGGGLARGVEYVIDAFTDGRGRVHEQGACGFTAPLTGPEGEARRAELERLAATR